MIKNKNTIKDETLSKEISKQQAKTNTINTISQFNESINPINRIYFLYSFSHRKNRHEEHYNQSYFKNRFSAIRIRQSAPEYVSEESTEHANGNQNSFFC